MRWRQQSGGVSRLVGPVQTKVCAGLCCLLASFRQLATTRAPASLLSNGCAVWCALACPITMRWGTVPWPSSCRTRMGYRHVDCAADYQNEGEVGEALAAVMADGTVRREGEQDCSADRAGGLDAQSAITAS